VEFLVVELKKKTKFRTKNGRIFGPIWQCSMAEKIDAEMRKIISNYLSYDGMTVREFARRVYNRYAELKSEGMADQKEGMWYR